MKKALLLVGIIGILAFSGMFYVLHRVYAESDDMKAECIVLEGDPAYAANLGFTIHNQWSNRLNWDVNVAYDDLGEPDIQVSYRADWLASETFRKRSYFDRWMSQDIYMNAYHKIHHDYESGTSSMEEWFEAQNDSYIEVFKAVAERTKAGEKRTETVRLGDYVDHYLVNLEIYVVDNLLWHQEDDAIISDYLRIDIPDSHTLEAKVTKDENGVVKGYGMDAVEIGTISFTCYGDADANGIYFSFYGSDGQNVVPLQIGAGNGIYFLPFEEKEDGVKEILAKDLRKVFALPEEDCYPLELILDAQKENLLLFTREKDKLVFRCIDKETMRETEKKELCDLPEHVEIKQIDLYEEEMFLFTNEGTMCYFRKEEQIFTPLRIINFGAEGPQISNYHLEYDWDYRDGKLVFLCEEDAHYEGSAYLYIADEKGIGYKAHFKNYGDYENDYGYPMIYLREEKPLEIS